MVLKWLLVLLRFILMSNYGHVQLFIYLLSEKTGASCGVLCI